jgi:DNA-binding protein HU-beta
VPPWRHIDPARKGGFGMDKDALVTATARKVAEMGAELSAADVERVVDALFGTVERPGAIAEAVRGGQTVTLLGFGDFHREDSGPVLRPGAALREYLTRQV